VDAAWDDTLHLTADMMVLQAGVPDAAALLAEVAPPALAHATAPRVRPWRGLALAAAAHALVVGLALVLIKLHMPQNPPDGTVVSVVVQSTPRGNTTLPVPVPQAKPALAPPKPVAPAQTASQPLVPPAPNGILRSAAVTLPKPTPAPQPAKLPPALVQGTQSQTQKLGAATVLATHPAQVDAGSTVIYPVQARALGEQGQVDLSIVVLPNGRPGAITIVKSSGYLVLDNAARDSVLTWHITPAEQAGRPVVSVLSYWVRFQLQ